MPRRPRTASRSNIYHVMLRGVNRQQIFYDDEDFRTFQSLLEHYKNVCGYKLYAYCIMGNHVHLLIQTGEIPLETIFRRLVTAFVYRYNIKYERVGHLFQGRFKSEPVENEAYLFTVLRYILQNPVAAGICSCPEDYPYSSAKEYIEGEGHLTDTFDVLQRMGIGHFRRYISQKNNDRCMEMNGIVNNRMTDEAARARIFQEFGTYSPDTGTAEARQSYSGSIKKLIGEGVSIRQLSRLTGISKKVIEKSLKR